jgi:hypothetical protein
MLFSFFIDQCIVFRLCGQLYEVCIGRLHPIKGCFFVKKVCESLRLFMIWEKTFAASNRLFGKKVRLDFYNP